MRPASKQLAILLIIISSLHSTGCSIVTDLLDSSPTPGTISQPTRTVTYTLLPTVTFTSTPTLTLTPTPTSTASVEPTLTLTPSLIPSATLDPLACLPPNEPQQAMVRWVSDGATIVVDIGGTLYSVRYIGIAAPQYIPVVEYMSPVAKTRNAELVTNRPVHLIQDLSERDRHGQLLRYVLVDGTFVNYQLVKEGLARALAVPPDVACAGAFQEAEGVAQGNQIGIWKATPTRFPTFTRIPTNTPTSTPRPTYTGTVTPTPSGSETPTPTSTSTWTPSGSPTLTTTGTITGTLTITPTETPTGTPTATETPSN